MSDKPHGLAFGTPVAEPIVGVPVGSPGYEEHQKNIQDARRTSKMPSRLLQEGRITYTQWREMVSVINGAHPRRNGRSRRTSGKKHVDPSDSDATYDRSERATPRCTRYEDDSYSYSYSYSSSDFSDSSPDYFSDWGAELVPMRGRGRGGHLQVRASQPPPCNLERNVNLACAPATTRGRGRGRGNSFQNHHSVGTGVVEEHPAAMRQGNRNPPTGGNRVGGKASHGCCAVS